MRKLLEALGLAGLAVLVWLTYSALYSQNRLPDRVPTHFDAAGNANAWGSPHMMIIMPLIALAIYLLLTVIAWFPSAFHYPVRVTPELLPRLQSCTVSMLAWIKVEMMWLFALLQWAFIHSARTGDGRVFAEILPGVLVVILGTVGWHIFVLLRTATSGAPSQ
jgi:uncharacterized membrane protein